MKRREPRDATVGNMKADGIRGLFIMCLNWSCRHMATVPFEAMPAVADEHSIDWLERRMRCTKCQELDNAQASPNWPVPKMGLGRD